MIVDKKVISHVSEKPWSEYKASDYTLQQWHNACLIHVHGGGEYTKDQCKLPVKTPSGSLNRNGVHAAAAALAGARGGVQAPEEEKAKAAKALIRYYKELGEEPPSSLVKHFSFDSSEFIEHHGIKGMRWGVRRKRSADGRVSGDSASGKPKAHELSDEDLRKAINRMQMERQYSQLIGQNKKGAGKVVKTGAAFVAAMAGTMAKQHIQNAANKKVSDALAKRAAQKTPAGKIANLQSLAKRKP